MTSRTIIFFALALIRHLVASGWRVLGCSTNVQSTEGRTVYSVDAGVKWRVRVETWWEVAEVYFKYSKLKRRLIQ